MTQPPESHQPSVFAPRRFWLAYAEAFATVAAFSLLRLFLQPWLGPLLPLFFALCATALVLWRRGTGPAIASAVAGSVVGNLLFAGGSFGFKFDEKEFLTLAAYSASCSFLIGFVHFLRKSNATVAKQTAELKATERKLQLALRTGRILASEWDLRGNQVSFYRPSNEPGEAPTSLSIDEAFRHVEPEDVARLRELIDKARRDGQEFSTEIRAARPSADHPGWYAVRASPIRDETGQVVRLIGTSVEITEYKEAERRKDEFLATLAHELRNPLAPIVSGLEVALAPDVDGETARSVLRRVQRQVGHIARLVDGLMDLTRISHGKLKLTPELCDLRQSLESATEMVQPLAESVRQRVEVSVPDKPQYVQGDHLRLAQTFGNLLMNAFKFTPDEGQITVRMWSEGDTVVTEVADTGIGMDKAVLDDVFKLFSQAPGGLTHRPVGLGVGLTVCKEIVRLHGGRIEAFSAGPGNGSRFTVTLPLAKTAAADKVVGHNGGITVAGLRRVLVVDHKDAADVLGLLLRTEGHEVEVCYSAAKALERSQEFQPDVIMVDLGMPEMDGYELSQVINGSDNKAAPRLIAVTGWGQESDVEKTRLAGFAAHLVKPASLEEIRKVLS